MKILVENSTWNNVGDGWYQASLYHLLKDLYPEHKVVMGEGPVRRSFRIKNPKHLANSLDLLKHQDADLHVFSGPMLGTLIADYQDAIIEIKNRKKEYAFISVSGTGLSKERIEAIGAFLKKYPPLLFSTRDEETYNTFSPYLTNKYNGVCTAFLVNKTVPTESFKLEKPFFISSFYTELEPQFSLKPGEKSSIENIQVNHKKTYLGLPFKYARHLNHLRPQQAEVGDHMIVRTIQNLNTKFNYINFALPNSFISFNPLTYLEVAKSSDFVISDRVHACAVNLAYNKPARFLFSTPRAGIFDRMGFDYKSNNGIIYPNLPKIDEEFEKLKEVIKKYI